jgi:hypothetical protein
LTDEWPEKKVWVVTGTRFPERVFYRTRAWDKSLWPLVKWRKTSTYLVPKRKTWGYLQWTPHGKEEILA